MLKTLLKFGLMKFNTCFQRSPKKQNILARFSKDYNNSNEKRREKTTGWLLPMRSIIRKKKKY